MRAKIQGRKIIYPSRGYPADGALEFVQTIISYIMTEILMVWQPTQHLNCVQTPKPKQVVFFFFRKSFAVLRGFCKTFAEDFCNFDGIANFFLRVEII